MLANDRLEALTDNLSVVLLKVLQVLDVAHVDHIGETKRLLSCIVNDEDFAIAKVLLDESPRLGPLHGPRVAKTAVVCALARVR